jgi:hypothetical protein
MEKLNKVPMKFERKDFQLKGLAEIVDGIFYPFFTKILTVEKF